MRKGAQFAVVDAPGGPIAVVNTHLSANRADDWSPGNRFFAMHRLGLGTLYHVRVGRPSECSCECLGFLAHGRCRHVQSLLTLTTEGMV